MGPVGHTSRVRRRGRRDERGPASPCQGAPLRGDHHVRRRHAGAFAFFHNKHWASDVALGAAVGTFSGLKVVRYSHAHPDNKVQRVMLHAFIAPDGAGGRLSRLRAAGALRTTLVHSTSPGNASAQPSVLNPASHRRRADHVLTPPPATPRALCASRARAHPLRGRLHRIASRRRDDQAGRPANLRTRRSELSDQLGERDGRTCRALAEQIRRSRRRPTKPGLRRGSPRSTSGSPASRAALDEVGQQIVSRLVAVRRHDTAAGFFSLGPPLLERRSRAYPLRFILFVMGPIAF